MAETQKTGNLNVRLIVLLLWIFLAFFYSCLAYDYIIASNKDKRLEEYIQYIVVVCGDDHRPQREVRSLVLLKANQLNLDLRSDEVGVSGNGPSLKIVVSYEVEIKLPILHRTIYRKPFQHEAFYRTIR